MTIRSKRLSNRRPIYTKTYLAPGPGPWIQDLPHDPIHDPIQDPRHDPIQDPRQDPPPARARKSKASLGTALNMVLERLSVPLGIVVLFLGFAVWSAAGLILGKISPQYMVTVQQFEITPEPGSSGPSLSGKGASDIVLDILNEAASHASQFHGTEYYKYEDTGVQPVSLHQAIKIPVQTSYGIALKGISLDNLLQLYDTERYQQWIVGGDIVSSPAGLVCRIRLNRGDQARFWETSPSAHANPVELVREATQMMLTSVAPEILGQAYLQQRNYAEAANVFRQWEIDDPQNWEPTYYLSLAYGYQNKEQEASNLADWSKNVKDHEDGSSKARRMDAASESEIASNLATTAGVVLQMRNLSAPQNTTDARRSLAVLQKAEAGLEILTQREPENVDYQIQRAKVLGKEALLESYLDPDSPKAIEWSKQAIESIDEAIKDVPENGGLHEQRGILLQDLVSVMKKRHEPSPDGEKIEREEIGEYIRALELRPTERSPLWAAIFAQIDVGDAGDAVDLARTITLLHPSPAASAAYIYALEHAINSPGKQTAIEREVEDRLGRFLQSNPDESQLLTVWDALKANNHRKALDLIAADGKRRFPENSTFEQYALGSTAALASAGISHMGQQP